MKDKQTDKKFLAETHPEISKQWNDTLNGDLSPQNIVADSNFNAWWLCPVADDHEWQARVADRTKANSRCPFCINYRLSKSNNLMALHPILANKWHFKKNYPLTPVTVIGTGQHKLYWWQCEVVHEWEASIVSHIRKDGTYRDCPKCNKEPLSITHPLIAAQWHPDRNESLTPADIRGGSPEYVWWKCPGWWDHEWKQRLVERTRGGTGCPFCDGKKLSENNTLLYRYPKLSLEWHLEKNGDLTPRDVFGGGKTKYWWKCAKGPDHEWQACIKKRAVGQGCPICRGLKVVGSNCLFSTHPDIAKEWHKSKNEDLTPKDVVAGSGRKVWWQCSRNNEHEWEATLKARTFMESGCPRCSSGWTVENIRLFVLDLLPYLHSLEPAELYDLFQEKGLLSSNGKGKSFIQALKTGRFPKEELEKFVKNDASLVDDFFEHQDMRLDNGNVELQGEMLKDVMSYDGMDLPVVQAKDVFSMLESNIMTYSADAEKVDFLIKSACAKIWRHAFANESEAQMQANQYNGENEYATQVKQLFMQEYEGACRLDIPVGYSIRSYQPNLMQRYIAYLVKTRKRIGNWSGTGAGKTLSAILASRVIDAKLTVICCPNNVIDTWKRQIIEAYPDSLVHTKEAISKFESLPDKHQYLILNYDFFQQKSSEAKLKNFIENCNIDFIILDEIHYSKQRRAKVASRRKMLVFTFLSVAASKNEKLNVLGMSATPVINDLFEGKTLIELVTGEHHDELDAKETVSNCVALYKKFVSHGVRYVPQYGQILNVENESINCNELIPRILGTKTRFEREVIFTEAKIPYILEQLRSKTIVYSYYREGIEIVLQDAIMQQGWKVGLFNGDTKKDFDAFIAGDIDVLIASSCIGTGIDRLQHICNRLIINSLPWTHAEFKQLIGRIYRQGQKNKCVDVFIPLAYVEINGERRSDCAYRWECIKAKKTFADAAVDGTIPEGHIKSPDQVYKDYMMWLKQIELGDINEMERQKIVLSFGNDNEQNAKKRAADFVLMNSRINNAPSVVTHRRFVSKPDEWNRYHELYGEARKTWDLVPYEEAIKWCKKRPDLTIGDFGCGEAILARELKNKVYSFDHVAINDSVIACDIIRVPLNDSSLGAAIYSLSLMGTNFVDYLREAYRCLKLDGQLWIAEPTSRIVDVEIFKKLLVCLGFDVRFVDQKSKFTFIEALKSDRAINEVMLQGIMVEQILV